MKGMGLATMQRGLLNIKFDRAFLRVYMSLEMRIYETTSSCMAAVPLGA
jgi:hypothetical protein